MRHVVYFDRGNQIEQTDAKEVDTHHHVNIVVYSDIYNDAVVNEVAIESDGVKEIPPVQGSVDHKRQGKSQTFVQVNQVSLRIHMLLHVHS